MDDDEARGGTASGAAAHSCPHVNRNDPRCATRFSLGRINQAFTVCFGAYHGCPMYHRINNEIAHEIATAAAEVSITITCRGADLPLRATGT